MAAVLGLRGTGSFTADTIRPKNYREGILLLFPNASAPLTALLSKLSEQATDDPEFKWFEKLLPDQSSTLAANPDTASTSMTLQTVADYTKFKPGHVILEVITGEIMWVHAVSASGVLSVVRAQGSVAATAVSAADTILIIGSAYSEGDGVSEAITYDPSIVSNYTQIFRNVFDITGTASATRIRYGDGQFQKEARREALELHSIEMERAFLWGAKVENTTYASQPTRTTGGLNYFVTTNVTDFGGNVDIDTWENFLQDVFKDGSAEKLALVGARALNVLNKVARAHYTIEATPTEKTYGMSMTTWITPYGVLQIKQHPLLSRDASFTKWGFVVDPAKIKYRYLRGRDTQYRENVQNPGDDALKNEFMSECGLEINHQTAHGIFKGANAFAA